MARRAETLPKVGQKAKESPLTSTQTPGNPAKIKPVGVPLTQSDSALTSFGDAFTLRMTLSKTVATSLKRQAWSYLVEYGRETT
jgi:hypothetical protein